jgi:hypothetical protein
MSRVVTFRLALAVSCLIPSPLVAQVPADLRDLMRTRDEAIAKADAATWDRLTAADFTVVLADGILRTTADRLAQFAKQQAATQAPVQQEQIQPYGDVVVRRSLRNIPNTGAAWILDVWVKDAKGWRVAAAQVTSAKK